MSRVRQRSARHAAIGILALAATLLAGRVLGIGVLQSGALFAVGAGLLLLGLLVADRVSGSRETAGGVGGMVAPAAGNPQEAEHLRAIVAKKTALLHSVSHELNTPLTPIRVHVHLLKTSPDITPAHRRSLGVLDRNVTRLTRIVQQLLDVARLDAGRLALSPARVDVSDLVLDAAETYVEPARAGGLTLEVDAPQGLIATADATRVSQILDNLISNSVKFTPAGGRIRIAARASGSDVLVHVRDSGIGMEPSDIPRLFQPFTQLHDPAAVAAPGTGLGLHICRGLAEQHGGALVATSEGRGRGAEFTLRLPAGDAEPALGPAAARIEPLQRAA